MMLGHQKQRSFLHGKFNAGQLSHAYVFSGPEGIGKKEFAKELVVHINKNIPGSKVAIEKEQFPDLLVVRSTNSDSSIKNEKDMMEIDVAQVRNINAFLSLKSYYGNYKAVIVEHAERMNTEAQHSFLKTLEEPKGKAIIILVSSSPAQLLPTIFSRCQTITFFAQEKYIPDPGSKKILQELLPMINSELAVKFQYTKKVNLDGNNMANILEVLARHFRNIMLSKIGVTEYLLPAGFADYSLEKIKNILQLIEMLHVQLLTTNANPKLALEILLIEL